MNQKILYVDSEGNFSVSYLKRIIEAYILKYDIDVNLAEITDSILIYKINNASDTINFLDSEFIKIVTTYNEVPAIFKIR